jgi:hypothetical protein
MASTTLPKSPVSLETVFNHLVLPPKIPGEQDADPVSVGHAILNRLGDAWHTITNLCDPDLDKTWASVGQSLRSCLRLNHGRLDKQSILQQFERFGPDVTLILHVIEQNAGLLIRQSTR